jgi:hypothetical protein
MLSWAAGAVIAANQVVDNQAVDEVQQPTGRAWRAVSRLVYTERSLLLTVS